MTAITAVTITVVSIQLVIVHTVSGENTISKIISNITTTSIMQMDKIRGGGGGGGIDDRKE